MSNTPNNTVQERENGWYFPGHDIEVAKTTTAIVKEPYTVEEERDVKVVRKNQEGVLEQQIVKKTVEVTKYKDVTKKVTVAATAEEAKEKVLTGHGINVDKDPAPFQPKES